MKELPVDLGQAEKKHNTAAKNISYKLDNQTNDKRALDIGSRDGYWSEKLIYKGFDAISVEIKRII